MPRRHLFDNGYPVSKATLLAGAEVLLALSRQSVRLSRFRLALTFLRLADSSHRTIDTAGRCDCSVVALRDSRENHSYGKAARVAPAQVEAGAGLEPGERPAREAPHR